MVDRNRRKSRVGTVVSTGMQKSAVVRMERTFAHPVFGKTVRRHRKVIIHDGENRCRVGDVVRIVETRPLSKRKRWRYVETVRGRA